MKILLTAHQFFPEHRAGTEVLTLGLARALLSRGHAVAVFAAKRSAPFTDLAPGATEEYAVDDVPVRRVGRPRESRSRPYRLNYESPDTAAELGRFVETFRPDVVHFMHLQGLSAAAIPVVKEEFGLPAVYTATDFWAVCPVVDLRRHDGVMCRGPDPGHCPRCLANRQPGSRLTTLMERTPAPLLRAADVLSRSPLSGRPPPLRQIRDLSGRPEYIRERVNSLDRILAPTRLTKDLLVANGIRDDLVEVSHYGIDVRDLAATPRDWASPSPSPVRFGFLGTLAPHKGCDVLIRAFKVLLPGTKATLTFHGGGEEFGDYQRNLRRLAGSDPGITFAGSFPRERIGEVLSTLDVLVVPSTWYENTPLVVYEAFASGTPVVATDLGGLSEVVEHDKNGLLFPLGDVDALACALGRLVGEPALIRRLREGIGPVKTVEESAAELEKLYNTLVDRGTVTL